MTSIRELEAGQQYGKLTVVQAEGIKNNRTVWLCRCVCGGSNVVPGRDLVSGNTKSCGCGKHKTGTTHPLWSGHGEMSGFYFSQLRQRSIERAKAGRSEASTFTVTVEYVWDLYLEQNRCCALSGVPIVFAKSFKDKNEQTASLDRIDSLRGYEPGNVQWVHKIVNQMKMNMTDDEFIEMCRKISNFKKD